MHGDAEAGLHLGPEPPDLLAASRAAATAVMGRRFGIVSACASVRSEGTHAPLHVYAAAGARRLPGWHFLARATGTGVSDEPELARLAAISEAVESYASMAPAPPNCLRRSSYAALHGRAIPPSRLALYSSHQYEAHPRLQRLADHTAIDWCQGWSLVASSPVWVPAALVYLSFPHAAPNNFVAETTSTGIAAHVTLTSAILAGALECMERDAVCIAWANRLQLRRLDPRGTACEAVLADARETGDEIALYDVPTDSACPTVMAVAWSESSAPHASVGVACRRDHEAAAFKATCEAVQMRVRMRGRPPATADRIRTFDDHADYYAQRRGARQLRDLVDGGPEIPLAQLPRAGDLGAGAALAEVIGSLRQRDLDLAVVELTTADIAAAGYRVVRVIIPGLVDSCADARFSRLGGERVYRVPVDLRLRSSPLAESQLNRLPSPLA